jgi:novobiocin biosynthesis protein NovU/D-mycarose 3-C-methyltransferase
MMEHFESLFQQISYYYGAPKSCVEIGSNDGLFLSFLRSKGVETVYGIDPSVNLCEIATTNGIPCRPIPFNYNSAYHAKAAVTKQHGASPLDLIVARHVFCHLDNWQEFIQNLAILADDKTVVCIEVPYVFDTLENLEFDQVYHEHLSFLTVRAMELLVAGTDFCLDRVERFSVHGGAIVLFLKRRGRTVLSDASVERFLAWEKISKGTWKEFWENCQQKMCELSHRVMVYSEADKTICGFGASAKSTVWINALGFTSKEIKFICDNTPQKIGRLSPGTDIPIVPETDLLEKMPDYAIMFAWNYKDEIISKNREYLDRGGHFIIPGKTLEVVGKGA